MEAIVVQLAVCYKNGIRCIIYCHRRSGECLNKAIGSSYTQIAVIEQHEQHEQDEGDAIRICYIFLSVHFCTYIL